MPVNLIISWDHIFPIWEKLENRGTFYVSPSTKRPGDDYRNV